MENTNQNETGRTCDECGATLTDTPSGTACVNVAVCITAATMATRRAAGETVKGYRAPAAWTVSGGVD